MSISDTMTRTDDAASSRANIWLAALVVVLLQCAALSYIIYGRASLLRNGQEILAEVIPVDPRDIFRGEYVTLGYTFSSANDIDLPAGTKTGDRVYSILKNTGGSKWELASVNKERPDKIETGQVVLSGIADRVWWREQNGRNNGQIRYGIEQFFVPEGVGKVIEGQIRDKKIDAILAVGADGQTAIKGLSVDGQRVYEEPVF
jgi:uncharacterized membrane-anchored protein